MSSWRPGKTAPPPGYVPGLGRGASGFVTRSDVGSASSAAGAGAAATGAASGSRAAEARAALRANKEVADNTAYEGDEPAEGQFDEDDDEADRIWDAIDERMQSRRKRKFDSDNDNTTAAAGSSNAVSQIGAQFRELKEKLADVTEDQWAAIPDVGDYSLKYKQKRRQQDTFTPMTDTLLEQRNLTNKDATAGGSKQLAGTAVAATNDGTITNMSGLSAARGTVLGMSLDKMSTTISDGLKTSIDATGYLTSLSSTKIATTAEVNDIHKARQLLQSVRDTNPKHGPGWIAAARVEEAAGKLLQARKIIQQGCKICSDNEDVWLEAARLHPVDVGKSILATAVRTLPHSVKIFLKAADMEHTDTAKKAVLRKAIEANPTSITLWKAAIELEDVHDAKVLLSVAVEKIPHSVEMWLALARLETYKNAQKVLNKARKVLPNERSIWIAAAKLEESQNHNDIVYKVIERAVKSLIKNDAVVTRAQWIQEAEAAEAAGSPITSAAIIKYTIGNDVDEEDKFRTWTEDVKGTVQRGSIETARAILSHAITFFPKRRRLWLQYIDLERTYGNTNTLDTVLQSACNALPNIELFWLLRAKEQWLLGKIDIARTILTDAFVANPDSEDVWLAAAKLEWENNEIERARVLLQRARDRAPSARVYMKSAILEREVHKFGEALQLIEEGISRYSQYAKLYMIGGQICSYDLPKQKTSIDRARKFYQRGIEQFSNNSTLWILASQLEENAAEFDSNNGNSDTTSTGPTKARSLLELARLKNPKTPELWLEAIRLERRHGNIKLAESLMAKALQDCPSSGILLAENIISAPRVQQKSKSADAIKRCPDDPRVICAVASLFASERKMDKARKWFHRAVVLDPDLGDSWARYYAFEIEFGTKQEQDDVLKRCIQAEPKHGEIWTSIMKDMKNRRKTIAEGLVLAAEKIARQKNNK